MVDGEIEVYDVTGAFVCKLHMACIENVELETALNSKLISISSQPKIPLIKNFPQLKRKFYWWNNQISVRFPVEFFISEDLRRSIIVSMEWFVPLSQLNEYSGNYQVGLEIILKRAVVDISVFFEIPFFVFFFLALIAVMHH